MRHAALVSAAVVAAAAKQPNFLVVMMDDLDELLNGTAAMPATLASLRDAGTALGGYVDVPICCPSRTSTLSGRYAHNLNDTQLGWCGDFGARHEGHTWVRTLRGAGYATALFGKYYNDYADFCGTRVHVPADYTHFYAMCNDNKYFGNAFNVNGTMHTVGAGVYMTDVLGNASLAWLRDAASVAAGSGAPFYAYFAPHAPHVPATPAHAYENAPLPGGASRAPRPPSWDVSGSGQHWLVDEKAPLTPALVNFSDALWARRLRSTMSVDDVVRALLAVLDAAGVRDSTYVLFTSDHGYNLGEHRLPSGKFHLFEHDIRVPFFVTGPGVAAGAQRVDVLVNNVDIGPTVLELAGVAADTVLDGRSFAAQLAAEGRAAAPPPWRDRLLFEYFGLGYTERGPCNNGTTACPNGAQALEDAPSNTWAGLRIVNATHNIKYAEFRGAASAPIAPSSTNFTAGFDLSVDPWEMRNEAAPGGAWPPAMLAALHAELWAVANCTGAACP